MVLTPTVLPNSFGVPPDLSVPYLFQARGLPRYGFCALEMPLNSFVSHLPVCGLLFPTVLLISLIIMIRTGKHKQLAVALNLQKFYFGFKTIVQSFSSMASSNPSLWISKPYEMIRFLHTYGHYHNFRFAALLLPHQLI